MIFQDRDQYSGRVDIPFLESKTVTPFTESQILEKGNESYKVLENNSNIRFE